MSYKDFEFSFEPPKNKLFSLADNDKTQQILINILDNAAKYSVNSKKSKLKPIIKMISTFFQSKISAPTSKKKILSTFLKNFIEWIHILQLQHKEADWGYI